MEDVLATLRGAVKGVLYPSETDAPLVPFVWKETKNTAVTVCKAAGLPPSIQCQEQSLDDFFGDLMDEKEFKALRQAIETTLSEVKVYRCGSIKVTYYVVGRAGAGWLGGFKTTAVET